MISSLLKVNFAFLILNVICFQGLSQVSFENSYDLPSYTQLWNEADIIKHPNDSGFFFVTGLDSGLNKSTLLISYDDTGKVNFCNRFTNTANPFSFNGIRLIALPDTTIMINAYMGVSSAFIKADYNGNILTSKQMINLSVITIYKSRCINNFIYGVGRCYFNSKQCALLAKFDLYGNALWAKAFETTNDRQSYLTDIIQTTDGGFLLTGNRFLYSGPFADEIIVFKTDTVGNISWQIQHGRPGINFSTLSSIQTNDGGYLIETSEGGNLPGGFLKLDSLGSVLWDKKYFTSGNEQPVLLNLFKGAGNGFIAGGMISYGNTPRPFSLTIDSIGNVLAAKKYGGYNNLMTSNASCYDPVKGMGITGYEYTTNQQTLFFMHTDPNLNSQCLYTNLFMVDSSYSVTDSVINYTSTLIPNFATLDITANMSTDTIDFAAYDYCPSQPSMVPVANMGSSDTVFCEKNYIDFFDLSMNNPTSWLWLFPGGLPASSTQQNPANIYYSSYGSFDVTLIACNAAGCDTIYLPGFIHELQSPPVPVVTSNADTLFASPAYSYQWYDSTSAIPGETGSYYIFQQPGSYYVIVTDSNGCATSSNAIYTGLNEVEVNNEDIKIIPNPTSGDFILTGSRVGKYEIYDVTGRVVIAGTINSSSEHIKLKSVDGIYFIAIRGSDYFIKKKIILKK